MKIDTTNYLTGYGISWYYISVEQNKAPLVVVTPAGASKEGLVPMLNLDDSTLSAVISNAKHLAHADARWLAAIDRAGVELAQNPYIERQASGGL